MKFLKTYEQHDKPVKCLPIKLNIGREHVDNIEENLKVQKYLISKSTTKLSQELGL